MLKKSFLQPDVSVSTIVSGNAITWLKSCLMVMMFEVVGELLQMSWVVERRGDCGHLGRGGVLDRREAAVAARATHVLAE